MKKQISVLILTLLSITSSFAQNDLLKELENEKPKEKELEIATFKGLQICNIQSTKMAGKKEWYFLVSHRFGDLTQGFENFFGLDDANTKIGGIYGITDWLTVGFSRHTYQKIYETTIKYRLANQIENGFPVTIVGYNTIDVNSELEEELYPDIEFSDRMAFSTQVLVSRKINEKFSVEITPVYVHKNLYESNTEQKDLFLLGGGARYKFAKRMSINMEYAARLNIDNNIDTPYHNPLTIGWDIETGGHIFQLVFSNSQQMNDVAYFSNALGEWTGGSLYFGFNLYRVF